MSELLDKRLRLSRMLAILQSYADLLGYGVTLGEGYVSNGTGHMKGSLHYSGLAQDINLYKDGVWLDKGPESEKAHNLLHNMWDLLGGAERIPKDLNHYSIAHGGKR
jgi:hypothetical protein